MCKNADQTVIELYGIKVKSKYYIHYVI